MRNPDSPIRLRAAVATAFAVLVLVAAYLFQTPATGPPEPSLASPNAEPLPARSDHAPEPPAVRIASAAEAASPPDPEVPSARASVEPAPISMPFHLSGRVVFSGRVALFAVRGDEARPTAGAVVRVLAFFRDGSPPRELARGVSDASGSFELEGESSAARITLLAEHPDGYARDLTLETFDFLARESSRDVRLIPAQPFRGVVLDPAGGPVAGAMIRSYGELRSFAKTDEAGAFDLGFAPPGRTSLWVTAPGLAARLDADVRGDAPCKVDVRLAPSCAIEGTIVDPFGFSTPDVRVELDEFGLAATTDALGRFRFADLPAGRCWIEAQGPLDLVTKRHVDLPCEPASFVLDMPPGFKGTAVDASGAPQPIAALEAWIRDDGWQLQRRARCTVDGAAFRAFVALKPAAEWSEALDEYAHARVREASESLDGRRAAGYVKLPPSVKAPKDRKIWPFKPKEPAEPPIREVVLVARSAAGEIAVSEILVLPRDVGRANLVLRFAPAPSWTLLATEAGSGAPIEGAKVVGTRWFESPDLRTGADGRLQLRLLQLPQEGSRPVSGFITAWADGFAPAGRMVAPAPGDEISIELERTRTVRGRVLYEDGGSLPGARVTLTRFSDPGADNELRSFAATSGSDGSFQIDDVSLGIWSIGCESLDPESHSFARLVASDLTGTRRPVNVERGKDAEVELRTRLARPGSARLRFTAAGEPLAVTEVGLFRRGSAVAFQGGLRLRVASVSTVATGELPPGSYRALVQPAGALHRISEPFEVASGARADAKLALDTVFVRGRITDAKTGSPIAGASLGIEWADEVERILGCEAGRLPPLAWSGAGAESPATGSDGTFVLDGVQPTMHALVVRAEGYLPRSVAIEAGRDPQAPLEIGMYRDLSLGRKK